MSITDQPAPHLALYRATGAKPSPDLHPNGVNHLALSTADMKAQLTFFAEVLGCPTRALYWMHGVPNTFHGFVELSGNSYIAFVQAPGNPTEVQWGITHSGNAGDPVTAGTMQHVAFNVDSIDDLLTMRDRIRSHGIQVMGPLDHGMIQSIYFAGPEGLSLEVCVGRDIDERQWVDPEVQGLCGISDDELARLTRPSRIRASRRAGRAAALRPVEAQPALPRAGPPSDHGHARRRPVDQPQRVDASGRPRLSTGRRADAGVSLRRAGPRGSRWSPRSRSRPRRTRRRHRDRPR